jgi:two-component system, OmpR family, heavy metal sensor histidine kinase CusS
MNLSFKNRIAIMFMLPTAALVIILLISTFLIVKNKVFGDLEDILRYEAVKHTKEIKVSDGQLFFANKSEMLEREHREADANPVFIQLVNNRGIIMDKSPNLKEAELNFDPYHSGEIDAHFKLNSRRIRQTQLGVTIDGFTVGYVITAVSSENAEQLVESLKKYIILTFPVVLIILFFTTRFLADKSIYPVSSIIKTANTISSNNLNQRISVPEQKDELYDLTISINNLLVRLHEAIEREKQFTSDAAHELRTPLAVLRGTLEVLIRKSRSESEYKEKISECITEIDRLTTISEQLLRLARMQHDTSGNKESTDIVALTNQIIARFNQELDMKNLNLTFKHPDSLYLFSNPKLIDLICENLLSNAIKYTDESGSIQIILSENTGEVSLLIKDNGSGIPEDKLQRIFDPFYRAHSLKINETKGTGLGLSIVRKACDELKATIKIQSEPEAGTEVLVVFPKMNQASIN